jgi:MoaA/NifB/PqqE/SkfB family radical SAM enzyme/2-polyprenyl-3-methyl-5-hydroxy-6-metoxy-1,4-benzoquinol methylase
MSKHEKSMSRRPGDAAERNHTMSVGINTLIVETMGGCNLKCKMCPTISYTIGKSLMSDSVFKKVLDIIKNYHLEQIDLTGWGEPLLDPKLEDKIVHIKQANNTLRVGFTTNGTLFHEERVTSILDSGVDWISISFDGASKEVYERIRTGSSYEKVLENLRFLSSTRDKKKTGLSAVCVVMRENLQEMDNFVELFYEFGFDSVVFKPLDVISKKEDLHSIVPKESICQVFSNLKQKYEGKVAVTEWDLSVNNIDNDCLARAASGAIFINCLGDVCPCCSLGHHVPNLETGYLVKRLKKDNFFSFGNIVSENFEDIIDSGIYKDFITAFKTSRLPEPCRGCRLISRRLAEWDGQIISLSQAVAKRDAQTINLNQAVAKQLQTGSRSNLIDIETSLNPTEKENVFKYHVGQLSHDKILKYVGKGKKVLEFGCSTGYVTRLLKEELNCQVTAIEIYPDAAEHASKYCERLIIGDADYIDYKQCFGNEKFDVIIFGDVLEHLKYPDKVLVGINDFIADSGYILASIPNIAHFSIIVELFNGRFDYKEYGLLDRTHLRFFTRESIYNLFESSGYMVGIVDTVDRSPRETEFKTNLQYFPSDLLNYIYSHNRDAETYQFIIKAVNIRQKIKGMVGGGKESKL